MARTFIRATGQAYYANTTAVGAGGTTALMVHALVRPVSAGASGKYPAIVMRDTSQRCYQFRLNQSLLVEFIGFHGATPKVVTSDVAVPVGVWSAVTATYDGAVYRVYINGRLAGTLSAAGANASSGISMQIAGYAAANDTAPSFTAYFFDGEIADCAEWTVCDPNVVRALARGASPADFPRGLLWHAPLEAEQSPKLYYPARAPSALRVLSTPSPARGLFDDATIALNRAFYIPAATGGGPSAALIPRLMRSDVGASLYNGTLQ